ncbi:MAG: hypothetical protein AAGB34_09280 [Planctomycetota bacterium]
MIALTASAAQAQPFALATNGGFEDEPISDDYDIFGPFDAIRRTAGDGELPANPPVFEGVASLQINGGLGGGPFVGVLGNPAAATPVIFGGGPITMTFRYNVPASTPWAFQTPLVKFNPRRPNSSFYSEPEKPILIPTINGGVGHTNGEWVQTEFTYDRWLIDAINNFQNDVRVGRVGSTFGAVPSSVSPLLSRFGALEFGQNETGQIFFDDVRIGQLLGDETPLPPRIIWNDYNYAGEVAVDDSIPEPAVPMYFNTDSSFATFNTTIDGSTVPYAYSIFFDGFQIAYDNDSDGFGGEDFQVVNIYDNPSGSVFVFPDFYPLTWQDVVVQGTQIPFVQLADGSSAGGTNRIITGPSLDTANAFEQAPVFSEASMLVLWNPESVDGESILVEGELVENRNARPRSEFIMRSVGAFDGGNASFVGERDYSQDPVEGQTASSVTYTLDVNSAVDMASAGGVQLFSMTAQRPSCGSASAVRAEVVTTAGVTSSSLVGVAPGADLFSSPVSFAVGDTIRLVNSTRSGTDDPTIEVTLDATSAVGGLSVQGDISLDGTVTLTVHWDGAPDPLPASSSLIASLTVVATSLEDVGLCAGDFDGDGDADAEDIDAFESAFNAQLCAADITGPTGFDFFDYLALQASVAEGCGE